MQADLLVELIWPAPFANVKQSKQKGAAVSVIEVDGQTHSLFTIDLGAGQSQVPVLALLFQFQTNELVQLQLWPIGFPKLF